ncbi:hypothetical protein J4414_02115 [Candidatus Woesearchaeota archaeon]|nr:hypothetical protein [Candidatus Woesearchaeota archaeon]
MKNLNIFLYTAIVVVLLIAAVLIQEKRMELEAKEICQKNNLSYQSKIKENSFQLKAALCKSGCNNDFCKVSFYQIKP